MSGCKRQLCDVDPDYEDVTDRESKRLCMIKNHAKESTRQKILEIFDGEFKKEIKLKEREVHAIDEHLYEAKTVIDRLRACIVANYYGSSAGSSNTPTLNVDSGLHPTLTKYATDNKTSAPLTIKSEPATSVKGDDCCSSESSSVTAVDKTTKRRQLSTPRQTVVIGNVSKYIPVSQREGSDQATHKWMLYVRGPRDTPRIDHVVHKAIFFLHPSYRPNDLVEVCQTPFHLTRRGWGEFPVRIQLHLRGERQKKVDVIHHLKLDKTYTGLQTLGAETVIQVDLSDPEEAVDWSTHAEITCNEANDWSIEHTVEHAPGTFNEVFIKQEVSFNPLTADLQDDKTGEISAAGVDKIQRVEDVSVCDFSEIKIKEEPMDYEEFTDVCDGRFHETSQMGGYSGDSDGVVHHITSHDGKVSSNEKLTRGIISNEKNGFCGSTTNETRDRLLTPGEIKREIDDDFLSIKSSISVRRQSGLAADSWTSDGITKSGRNDCGSDESTHVLDSEETAPRNNAANSTRMNTPYNSGRAWCLVGNKPPTGYTPGESSASVCTPTLVLSDISVAGTRKQILNQKLDANSGHEGEAIHSSGKGDVTWPCDVENVADMGDTRDSGGLGTDRGETVRSVDWSPQSECLRDVKLNATLIRFQETNSLVDSHEARISRTFTLKSGVSPGSGGDKLREGAIQLTLCNGNLRASDVGKTLVIQGGADGARTGVERRPQISLLNRSNHPSYANRQETKLGSPVDTRFSQNDGTNSHRGGKKLVSLLGSNFLRMKSSCKADTSGENSSGKSGFFHNQDPGITQNLNESSRFEHHRNIENSTSHERRILGKKSPGVSSEESGPSKNVTNTSVFGLINKEILLDKSILGLKKRSIKVSVTNCDPNIEVSKFHEVSELVRALMPHFPIIDENVDKQTHPYCAKTWQEWLEWGLGKRRASEWQRALDIRRCMERLINQQNLSVIKPEHVWRTKRTMVWCRRHAFSPHYLEVLQPEDSPSFCSDPLNSLSDSTLILDKLAQSCGRGDGQAEDNRDRLIIDVIGYDPVSSKNTFDKRISVNSATMTASEEAVCIQEITRKVGFKFEPVTIEEGDTAPLVEHMLYSLGERFMEDVLRASFCSVYTSLRSKDELRISDIYQGIRSLPQCDFLTNANLGAIETKHTPR